MAEFKPATEVSEVSTGAVRSPDLAKEEWQLISWHAVELLADTMKEFKQYALTPDDMVANSAFHVGQFLAGNGLDHLKKGWAYLAVAIQKQDSADFNNWAVNAMQRQKDIHSFAFLPYHALKHLATTCHEGAVKYGHHNWLYGFPVSGLCNHLVAHLIKWLNGDRTEDHLGHCMWGFMASIHMFMKRPDMCEDLLGQNYQITKNIENQLREHACRRANEANTCS